MTRNGALAFGGGHAGRGPITVVVWGKKEFQLVWGSVTKIQFPGLPFFAQRRLLNVPFSLMGKEPAPPGISKQRFGDGADCGIIVAGFESSTATWPHSGRKVF